MVAFSVYMYDVEMITKFRWESGFPKEPLPLCTNIFMSN